MPQLSFVNPKVFLPPIKDRVKLSPGMVPELGQIKAAAAALTARTLKLAGKYHYDLEDTGARAFAKMSPPADLSAAPVSPPASIKTLLSRMPKKT